MPRRVITTTVTIPATGTQPARTLIKGQVVELSAAEEAAVTANGGAVRPTATVHQHDSLGESAGVHNSI